jgi:ATP-dependent Clp protease adaptor protein ClpS
MSERELTGGVEGTALIAKAVPAVERPKKYKVVLLNDDYTPMVFVVDVLKTFFHVNDETAVQIMLQVHVQGRGVCGVFTYDIAETKVVLVNEYAKVHEYPLLCKMEPE